MKQKTADNITAFLAGLALFALVFVSFEAMAGGYEPKPNQEQSQHQDQAQGQDQGQTQTATGGNSASDAAANASASNDGNTLEGGDVNVGGDSVENNSSNVVLVPNNNTESCVRVFGLAFGKNGESGAIGWPWRSAKCDFEQAADDAFAAGERELGWFWKCHNKNLYKQFRDKDESKETAINDCHDRMLDDARDDVVADLETQVEQLIELREVDRAEINRLRNRAANQTKARAECTQSLTRCEEKAYGTK